MGRKAKYTNDEEKVKARKARQMRYYKKKVEPTVISLTEEVNIKERERMTNSIVSRLIKNIDDEVEKEKQRKMIQSIREMRKYALMNAKTILEVLFRPVVDRFLDEKHLSKPISENDCYKALESREDFYTCKDVADYIEKESAEVNLLNLKTSIITVLTNRSKVTLSTSDMMEIIELLDLPNNVREAKLIDITITTMFKIIDDWIINKKIKINDNVTDVIIDNKDGISDSGSN